jgi:hypothetical protein
MKWILPSVVSRKRRSSSLIGRAPAGNVWHPCLNPGLGRTIPIYNRASEYFNYIGCNISYCERKEVNNKVNKFQRMSGIISRTLKGNTQLSTQIKFHKVMTVPVLMYSSDNWSLNLSDKRKIEPAEMRCLRPMEGYTLWDKKVVT